MYFNIFTELLYCVILSISIIIKTEFDRIYQHIAKYGEILTIQNYFSDFSPKMVGMDPGFNMVLSLRLLISSTLKCLSHIENMLAFSKVLSNPFIESIHFLFNTVSRGFLNIAISLLSVQALLQHFLIKQYLFLIFVVAIEQKTVKNNTCLHKFFTLENVFFLYIVFCFGLQTNIKHR